MRRPILTLFALVSTLSAVNSAPVPSIVPGEYETPLPVGAVARLGTTRFRHGATVLSLDVSADGKMIASVSEDGAIFIWDAASGRRHRAIRVEAAAANSVSFSPDGKNLLTNFNHDRLEVISLADGKSREVPKSELPQWSRWAPDGRTIAALLATEETLRLFDAETFEPLREFKKVAGWGFAPDGKAGAVSYMDGKVQVVDLSTGEVRRNLPTAVNQSVPVKLEFDSKGEWVIAGCMDRSVIAWNLVDGKQTALPDAAGTFAVVPGRAEIFLNSTGAIVSVALESGKRERLKAETEDGSPIAALPGGERVVVLDHGSRIRVVNLTNGREEALTDGHSDEVTSLFFTADGKHLGSGGQDGLRLWKADSFRELPRAHEVGRVDGLQAFDGGKRLLTIGEKQLTIRDGVDLSNQSFKARSNHSLRTEIARTRAAAFTADGRKVVFASGGGRLKVADVESGEVNASWQLPSEPLSMAFQSRGGCLAVHCQDGFLRAYLWPIDSKSDSMPEPIWVKRVQRSKRGAVAFSADGLLIAVFSAGKTVLVESLTGRQWRGLDREFGEGDVRALAFSPDGRLVAAAHGGPRGFVRLWDVATGRLVETLKGHEGNVNAIAFSPDGKLLASAGSDTSILVWNVPEHSLEKIEPMSGRKAWELLDSLDIGAARTAVLSLVALGKDGVAIIREGEKLAAERRSRIRRSVSLLGAEDFRIRRAARADLEKEGDAALPFLHDTLAKKPDAEVERLLNLILESLAEKGIRLPESGLYGDSLQRLRALQVLEAVGGPEATDVVRKWATAAGTDRVAREIAAALQRMEK